MNKLKNKEPRYVFVDGKYEIRGYDDYIVVVRFYLVGRKMTEKVVFDTRKLK